ncbi:protein FANTASTIC FOUR 1 [Euphorbia lathyris]|uniref:protein FANTASTIC FOUR 1 n=1 Tax=Euphorbia lathyris TaxID=212925 RepID=UPI00331392FA
MAACKSLHHIFEKPLPESPSLLPWNSLKSIEQSSFTELFGELHFKDNSSSSSSSSGSSSSFIDLISSENESETKKILPPSPSPDSIFTKQYNASKNSINGGGEVFSPIKNCESLQLCTEGLGFESFDDVEDMKNEDWQQQQDENISVNKRNTIIPEKKLRSGGGGGGGGGGFPPPISCIGKSGKPWVSFKSYRHDGRFVLKQVKMPSQEFLHAHREDGRLKLHFVQPSEEILEDEEEEDEEEDEDGEDEENCIEEHEQEENEETK